MCDRRRNECSHGIANVLDRWGDVDNLETRNADRPFPPSQPRCTVSRAASGSTRCKTLSITPFRHTAGRVVAELHAAKRLSVLISDPHA
jgi:hypothetical protein